MWKYRSSLGLLGNHIDVITGSWTARDATIGSGVDSYFEYLVKGAALFRLPELDSMFRGMRFAGVLFLNRNRVVYFHYFHHYFGSVSVQIT